MVTRGFTDSLVGAGDEIRKSWGWFLFLGILLIVFGVICIAGSTAATYATVFVLGWLLLLGGIVSLIDAFMVRSWNGFLLFLLSALFRGFTGYLLLRYPRAGAVGLTMILASFLIVGGLFRAIGAATLKLPSWGWSEASGIVSIVLGIMLLAQIPSSSMWFIGFVIGVDMVMEGVSLIGFATAIHHLPTAGAYRDFRDRDVRDRAA
jgi:uncharacterized membrane protein HdeD (DUF308 family)